MKKAAPLIILIVFVACFWMTSPKYIGDTIRYVGDVMGHAEGQKTQFWEFGHLLWRPWGYVGHSVFGSSYRQWFGDTPGQVVARFLINTTSICSALALVFLLFLLRKVARPWIAVAVVFALSCAVSFLNYSHAGAPYVPGLMFSALALWLLTKAADAPSGGRVYAILAGVSFAFACALWFTFCLTGLGMVAVPYVWTSGDTKVKDQERGPRLKLIAYFLVALGVSTLLLFSAGAAVEGIRSMSDFMRWVREADNGWAQSKTAMRAITGLPRSVWDLGHDTVYLKRWLFSDPYNPARISTLVFSLGTKLALFYLGVGAVIWALWRGRRAILVMLLAAGVPLVLFAILLFEPSSPERFLPVFPFLFLGFAAVLDRARRHLIPSALIVALLAGTTLVNLRENINISSNNQVAVTKTRVQALDRQVQPGALVMVVGLTDDLYTVPAANPLDNSLSTGRFRVRDTVVLASRNTARWRTEFAQRAQEQWAQNKEVWVSERFLAPRPKDSWWWVEGDDRRVRWSEFPEEFGKLVTDLKVPADGDGFLRLAQTPANREQLAKWAALAGTD